MLILEYIRLLAMLKIMTQGIFIVLVLKTYKERLNGLKATKHKIKYF